MDKNEDPASDQNRFREVHKRALQRRNELNKATEVRREKEEAEKLAETNRDREDN